MTPLELLRDRVIRMTSVDPEAVRPDSRFIDFGLDSVRALDLVVELEETFGVTVDDRDLADLHTLQDVADYVERRSRAE